MHQLLAIHIGQCGIQIGSALWELLTFEHFLSEAGYVQEEDTSASIGTETLFHQCSSGHCVPRAVFIDLEPTVIDELKNGSYRRLFHPDQLIKGPEDSSNNFARGFYNLGRLIKFASAQQIRKEIEKCDNLQGIHLYRSLGGGTGSGVTAAILEVLSDYAKLPRLEIPIHPSPNLTSAVVEPYNCILSEHFCMEDIDMSLLVDNEALYDIITNEVSITKPTMNSINRILAQVCSSLSCATRFPNELCNDFTNMTNLVPYPRIHFPLVSYAPFGNTQKLDRDKISISEITKAVFWVGNQMVKCDPSIGRFMSCSLLYRGKLSPTAIFDSLAEIKAASRVRFVDWCPTGFKVGIVNKPPQILPDSNVGLSPINVIMMTNNSAVSTIWHRLSQKFHGLYSKRSFVHWFVAEGLEENEFCEALYNIATLAKDYEEISLDTEHGAEKTEGNGSPSTSPQEISSPVTIPEKSSTKVIDKGKVDGKTNDRASIEPAMKAKEVIGVDKEEKHIVPDGNKEDNKAEDHKAEDSGEDDNGAEDNEANEKENASDGKENDDDEGENEDGGSKSDDKEDVVDKSGEDRSGEDDSGEDGDDDEAAVQENVSNILLLNFNSGERKFKSTNRGIKPLFPFFKSNCVNIKKINAIKKQSRISNAYCNENLSVIIPDKTAKSKDNLFSERDRPVENTFNSNLFKRNFIKKCANQRRCFTSFDHVKLSKDEEEGTQSLMDELIKMTEKI